MLLSLQWLISVIYLEMQYLIISIINHGDKKISVHLHKAPLCSELPVSPGTLQMQHELCSYMILKTLKRKLHTSPWAGCPLGYQHLQPLLPQVKQVRNERLTCGCSSGCDHTSYQGPLNYRATSQHRTSETHFSSCISVRQHRVNT